MAHLNPNATAEMTENDSMASLITTVLGGMTGAPYDRLLASDQEADQDPLPYEDDKDGMEVDDAVPPNDDNKWNVSREASPGRRHTRASSTSARPGSGFLLP